MALAAGLAGGLLAACSSAPAVTRPAPTAAVTPVLASPTTASIIPPPTLTPTVVQATDVEATATLAAAPPAASQTPTPAPTLGPQDWQQLPVVPVVNPAMLDVYRRGLELGNNPSAFVKVGDCETTPTWFLGDFDRKDIRYRLGDYIALEGVIAQFKGSFLRESLAARSGFNAASVFSPLWADPKQCESGESPIQCEYRLQKPSIAFIMLGTNDHNHIKTFESNLRAIIEFSLEQGVVPVLATKADNLEGDGSINLTIARLAQEYQVPLWNFWAAVQDLPDGGLQEDGAHLTWMPNLFDDPEAMKRAWPVRNLTALQALDAVWRAFLPR